MPSTAPSRILVIKLSALGDFVLSIGSFQAIRSHHPEARITLLTTAPFVSLAESLGCFDEVWIDRRPRWRDPGEWLALARRLRRGRFDRVYDLQRSQRSAEYFHLAGRPEWVGVVRGAKYRYVPPRDRVLHITERETAQLALAGIPTVPLPDLSPVEADVARFGLPLPYALLVPGSAPHRPAKRWPAPCFAALANVLARRRLTPVLLGTAAEERENAKIAAACPQAHDLTGRTELQELVALGRGATLAVGNDTGPMHLIAAAGCPSLALFSAESDPAKAAPRGASVAVLREAALRDLPVERVVAALNPWLNRPTSAERA